MTEANPEKEKMPAPEIRETDSGEKGPTDNGAGIDPLLAKENCSFFREVNIEFLVHELKDPVSIIETGVRLLIEKGEPISPPQSSSGAHTGADIKKCVQNPRDAQRTA